jgi:hypothetical protein
MVHSPQKPRKMRVRYSDQPKFRSGLSIFLAGPTPRVKPGQVSAQKSWRPEALEILERLEFEGTVLVPERTDWSAKFEYTDQTEWEWSGLHGATVIVFWVPRKVRKLPAFTTNIEFGHWIAEDASKVLFGGPKFAERLNRYMTWLYNKKIRQRRLRRVTYATLEETLKAAVELAHRLEKKAAMAPPSAKR